MLLIKNVYVLGLGQKKKLHQDADGRWVIDWDYESLLSLHSDNKANMRVTRVGFVRYQEGLKPEEEEGLSKALEPFGCVPVFLEESLAKKFYRDFCKVTLFDKNKLHGLHSVLGARGGTSLDKW